MKRSILAIIIFSCLTACVSFESVKTVGKTGKVLSDFKEPNEDFVFLCKELNKLDNANSLDCEKVEARIKTLNKGIDGIIAYSNALLLAVEEDEFKLSDIVEQTVKAGSAAQFISASDDELAGLKGIATGVQQLLTSVKQRKSIHDAIQRTNPSIEKVCVSMIGIVQLQKQAYQNYTVGLQNRLKIDLAERNRLAKPIDLGPSVFNDMLFFGNMYVKKQNEKLDIIEKNILAFQKGHEILNSQTRKFNRKEDSVVLKSIIKSLSEIFEGLKKFDSSENSNN